MLVGDEPEKDGHYITVWAPRQTGKTWIMCEVLEEIRLSENFEVGIVSLQSARSLDDDDSVLEFFVQRLGNVFSKELPPISSWKDVGELFVKEHFEKPVILILDEFDALGEEFIDKFANELRDMYIRRRTEIGRASGEKSCLLHGVGLIGVRSVLGVENAQGSPFNVQRSARIPNLTFDEVVAMFKWYEKESGQDIGDEVVERVFRETCGQPGLVSWFGELLTETYNKKTGEPITSRNFEFVFKRAVRALPNNFVIDIVSKAKQEPYKETVLEIFRTERKVDFHFDDPRLNFLYMNGVIDIEEAEELYAMEIKSFTHEADFREANRQSSRYAETLGLDVIHLVVFVEHIPDELRAKYETDIHDENTGVNVSPVFVSTGT